MCEIVPVIHNAHPLYLFAPSSYFIFRAQNSISRNQFLLFVSRDFYTRFWD